MAFLPNYFLIYGLDQTWIGICTGVSFGSSFLCTIVAAFVTQVVPNTVVLPTALTCLACIGVLTHNSSPYFLS